jgi:Flp pilus assembly protein TadG
MIEAATMTHSHDTAPTTGAPMSSERGPGGILTRIAARARRFRGENGGVAAIEFAFVAPVLLVLYFMTMEVSQGLEVNKKTSRIAIIVGDLLTQQQSIDKSGIDAIMKIGEAVVQPYNRTSPTVYATGIFITNEATPKARVVWSRKLVNGAASNHLAKDSLTSVPAKLMIPNTFLVRSEARLDYKPVLVWSAEGKDHMGFSSAFDDIDMYQAYHLRPRMSQQVTCSDC